MARRQKYQRHMKQVMKFSATIAQPIAQREEADALSVIAKALKFRSADPQREVDMFASKCPSFRGDPQGISKVSFRRHLLDYSGKAIICPYCRLRRERMQSKPPRKK
jgi:hypothetical protein